MSTARTSETWVTITGVCCDYVVTIGTFKGQKAMKPLIYRCGSEVVAGGGIEPPTQGFSDLLT